MLKDCIEIFEKELLLKGENLIIDNYLPSDGTYVIVSTKDDEFFIKDVFDIKYNKKLNEIEGRENIYFKQICEYDYNSKLIDMNKPIDTKKVIHSNNYLSFFIKKESITNKKITSEIIENYYKILSNPKLKYKTLKAKEIYNSVEENLEDIDQEFLQKIQLWIKENIFKLDNLGIEIKGKDYLKIFFEVPIEKYINEGKRYLIPNIYNSNDFNQIISNEVYGLHNNNMGLNSKKPYLENKSRKTKVPYLLNQSEVLLQKKFFDYLLNLASKGQVNVYINDTGIKSFKNDDMIDDKDFNGIYMRIKKGKELEIQSYDLITSYKYLLKKPFKLQNILDLSDKYIDNEYEECGDRKKFQSVINNILFSKYLVNNYFTDAKDISIKDNILKKNLLISRDKIFGYIYKGNEVGVYEILNKVSLELIKNNIIIGNFIKASHQYNMRCSLENYFKGGVNMSDLIYDIKSKLREKINSEDTQNIEDDKEYYFALGQFINYLLSKSKSNKKVHSLANPFINAKNDRIIKDKLRNIYKKYNYDINMNSKRVNNLYAMIVSYESQGKVNQDMIIAGYLHSNLIYESNKGE